MLFNKKSILFKLLVLATVASDGIAIKPFSGTPHVLSGDRPYARAPQRVVGVPQNLERTLENTRQPAVRRAAPSNASFQTTFEDTLLKDSITLARSLLQVNLPHHHDGQIPTAVSKIETLFRRLNPNAELKTFCQARIDILSYAKRVDQGFFGHVPRPVPGASNHKTYHDLVTKRIDYREVLKTQTEKLLPMCLYFAELDKAEKTLVMNFGMQEGSTDSALYNNLFVYLAKRLEGQKNGSIPGSLYHPEREDKDLAAAIALSLQGNARGSNDEDKDLAAAIALSSQESARGAEAPAMTRDQDLEAAIAASLKERDIVTLVGMLNITKNEAIEILKQDPNAVQTFGIK